MSDIFYLTFYLEYKKRTFETRENAFYFTPKILFVILLVWKAGNEVLPVYVILQKKIIYKKTLQKSGWETSSMLFYYGYKELSKIFIGK